MCFIVSAGIITKSKSAFETAREEKGKAQTQPTFRSISNIEYAYFGAGGSFSFKLQATESFKGFQA